MPRAGEVSHAGQAPAVAVGTVPGAGARAEARLAAFGYHEVTDDPRDSGFQRPSADAYKLTRRAFSDHLDGIAECGLGAELVVDLDFSRPGRHVLLTFDDGGKSASYVSEALLARGWRGHFFVVTDLIGSPTFLEAAEIRRLRNDGHVVGSHSHTHPGIFREQPRPRMLEEWRVSCDCIAQLLGEPCVTASVPGGDVSSLVFETAAEAGIRHLFTSEPSPEPRRVHDCWVVGRYMPKLVTPAVRVRELARFRGWPRALLHYRVKLLARLLFPLAYRRYVRLRARPGRGD